MSRTMSSNKSAKGKSIFKKADETQNPKRKIEDEENTSFDLDGADQIGLLLQEFGGRMQKKLQSKHKKMKQEIEESVEVSSSEVLSIFNNHEEERQALFDNFHSKLSAAIERETSTMQKQQEIKNQLQKAMKQQEKEINQLITKKSEHLNAMKSTSEIFFHGVEELRQAHKQQCDDMYNEMQGTLKTIYKKVQAGKQEQAMSKLRQNLQSLLKE